MKQVTITQKDIEKRDIQNTDSGYIIDELAYACGQWTSNELYENNFDYEPHEPYCYDFEADLFEHTKTKEELNNLAERLDVGCTLSKRKSNLQAGAYMALHNPTQWQEMLTAWESALRMQDDWSEGNFFSEKYQKELEEDKQSFHDDLYKEWLNGDYRGFHGVVFEIAKYFTDERDGDWDEKKAEYTFNLNEYDLEKYKEAGYRSNQIKRALLDEIKSASDSRCAKDRADREKRQKEYAETKAYKEQRAKEAEEERKKKLLAMKIK